MYIVNIVLLYLCPHIVVDGGVLFHNRTFFLLFFCRRMFEVAWQIGSLYSSEAQIV